MQYDGLKFGKNFSKNSGEYENWLKTYGLTKKDVPKSEYLALLAMDDPISMAAIPGLISTYGP